MRPGNFLPRLLCYNFSTNNLINSRMYITFKIKAETAAEFRSFSRKLGKQQSECLQLMLDFFKIHSLSPLDELGPNLTSIEQRIKGRINALIAILRDIEKTQTKPTLLMLQLLFQENTVKKNELLMEKKQAILPQNSGDDSQSSSGHTIEDDLRKKLLERTKDLKYVLEKVSVVRSSFGVPHFRLNISHEEYDHLKSKL